MQIEKNENEMETEKLTMKLNKYYFSFYCTTIADIVWRDMVYMT